jgi:hypothetical protein
MRSRPKVQVLLTPPVATAGDTVRAETILRASTVTPVDFVTIALEGEIRVSAGSGKRRRHHVERFLDQRWKWASMTLAADVETKLENTFTIPWEAPPSYLAPDATISYAIMVHVAIPWWLDQRRRFALPLERSPALPPEPTPAAFASSGEGPRGTEGFIELALDSDRIPVGAIVTGSVSVANLRKRHIREITVTFVETEYVTRPYVHERPGRRFKLVAHEGPPPEGVAIPFRFRLPDSATVNFDQVLGRGALGVSTHVEARANVAWGDDIVARGRVEVLPRATEPRVQGSVAPLGRARQAVIWRTAAKKHDLLVDPDVERIHGQRGRVTLEIAAEYRANDFWLVAKLGWQDLGLDLTIAHARWIDLLARNVVKSGENEIDDRLIAHAREPEQVRALVTADVLRPFLAFEETKIVDDGARLALRGSPQDGEALTGFVVAALDAAEAIDRVLTAIPPPALFAGDLPCWEAFAARLGGRLEVGRMWIKGGHLGPTAVEIGSSWERSGLHVGSEIGVEIDPPLEGEPPSLDDPSISPAARDAWRELTACAKSVDVGRQRIAVRLEDRLADPQTAMPVLELAVSLRRALAGTANQGPFR